MKGDGWGSGSNGDFCALAQMAVRIFDTLHDAETNARFLADDATVLKMQSESKCQSCGEVHVFTRENRCVKALCGEKSISNLMKQSEFDSVVCPGCGERNDIRHTSFSRPAVIIVEATKGALLARK